MSVCIPEVAKQVDQLPVDICDQNERCSPCYDPRTGQGTGACTMGYCDKGPSQPPKVFQPCGPNGNTHAYCVPKSLVPAKERSNFDSQGCLAPISCKEPGTICVPKKVMDAGATFQPAKCKNNLWALAAAFKNFSKSPLDAIKALLSKEFKEGRCLSICIPKYVQWPLSFRNKHVAPTRFAFLASIQQNSIKARSEQVLVIAELLFSTC